MSGEEKKTGYGCSDYRDEMRLMGLKRRLTQANLTEEEKIRIAADIEELEKRMGLH